MSFTLIDLLIACLVLTDLLRPFHLSHGCRYDGAGEVTGSASEGGEINGGGHGGELSGMEMDLVRRPKIWRGP